LKLSKNFSLKELTYSQTAIRNGISNLPNDEQLVNLTALCQRILQPVRDKYGVVSVSSGLRAEALNALIGGSKTSDHCYGRAADFEVKSEEISNLELAKYIQDTLEFKQLILEFYNKEEGPNSGWVHCSFDAAGNNKGEVLTAKRVDGKVQYYEGLEE
tara:strand:- start:222 stop:695 length:474 start_codon:yes stop_codon:yes gene_type:complete